ncbi:DUF58 domain-containing protein [Bacillus sp. T33-2]|uniref:DUF58 domain-containing protein n=1 Tax=Bacillus sp. T33-2 TaxID=2054168 RepID=UPI000C7585E5|nr:DUF58 domain-containing protein [Bacillus sp. T33-2]PLR98669.1 DUF58 domain-containing protein [Bacillus sp. T33-2]
MRELLKRVKEIWKLLVLFLLILLAFSYAMFQGGFVSWFLFYSFLPFALYALGLTFYGLKDITAERIYTKAEYNAGEKLKVSVILERNTPFPLLYTVAEEQASESLAEHSQMKTAKSFLFPGFNKVFHFEYTVDELPRGEHFFSGIRIKTGDPLGLIEKETLVPVEDKILVYPAYEPLVYNPFENHYDQGMTASKERVQRDTSMAIGVREYQPGDRFSWINWKATAKRNDIMTKEFEQRQTHDVSIIMDCAPDKRFETIVSFTASLVKAILRKGAQVGLLTASSERAAYPIRGGEIQQQQLFYHLAKIRDNSPVTLDRVMEGETFLAHQNVTLMLVTAQLTKGLVEKASFYSQRNGAVTIFLIKKGKELPAQDELALKTAANARGVAVTLVHEGGFKDAFSEVKRG